MPTHHWHTLVALPVFLASSLLDFSETPRDTAFGVNNREAKHTDSQARGSSSRFMSSSSSHARKGSARGEATSAAESELPSVLLLGGLGMVGISLLQYLVDFKLASFIRVVDKRVPAICNLSPAFLKALSSPEVEVMQADVSVPQHVERAFAPPTPRPAARRGSRGRSTGPACFTIIVNAAAETGYGYLDVVYEQNILTVRQRCAAAAAALSARSAASGGGSCECYIEVSTALVYDCGESPKRPATERDGVVAPWTTPARYHAAAEAHLQHDPACANLPWLIVRLPVVYGPGDRHGLMPRIACAATYARTGARMELLWGAGLRLNTVHVQDAVSAIWHLACTGNVHEIYNVCDDGDTSQGSLNTLLSGIFGIQTGFYSHVMSKIAATRLEQLAEEANECHMEVWNSLLREAGIPMTCISPYVEPELLTNKSICIDNAKLKALGFVLSCPKVTKELLEDAIEYWTSMKLFPPKSVIHRATPARP